MSDTLNDDFQDAQDEREAAPTQQAQAPARQALPTSQGPAPTIVQDAPLISLASPTAGRDEGKGAAPSFLDYAKSAYNGAVEAGADTLGAAKWVFNKIDADPELQAHVENA